MPEIKSFSITLHESSGRVQIRQVLADAIVDVWFLLSLLFSRFLTKLTVEVCFGHSPVF